MEKTESKKQILYSLIALSVPVMLEQILSTLLQYVDTAMVGQLGEKATAAVSVTTTINWLTNCLPSAVSVAALTLISREVGANDEKRVRELSAMALKIALFVGSFLTILCVGVSHILPVWMNAEPDIVGLAGDYYMIISLPMIFRCLNIVLSAAIRATKDTKTPMFISVGTNVINIGLNYLLIFVFDLGVRGAAIGTAISYTVGGILMYAVLKKKCDMRLKQASNSDLRLYSNIGLPVLLTSVISCSGYVVFARLVSGMGTTTFAAHSIAVNLETLFYISGYGLKTAASTLVGISIGERNEKKFNDVCQLGIMCVLIMMSFSGLCLFVLSPYMMPIFTSSKAVADIGAAMLKIVAFSEPFFGLMVMCEGILYGLGRPRYVLFVELFGMWAVRILFSYVLVLKYGKGLEYVWYCMIADNVSKALILTLPFLKRTNRTRMFERVNVLK